MGVKLLSTRRFPVYASRYFFTSSICRSSILCGIEPNGPMHIGNYFGTFENCVRLQSNERRIMCSVSDMLSITLPYKPQQLPEDILVTTACLIGCGLQPEKNFIFLQSQISQHSLLCWILGCLTDLTELPGNHTGVPLGVYLRPLLQATDAFLFNCSDMCIGCDKSHQLPLIHNLANKINEKCGDTFRVPNPLIYGAVNFKNLRYPVKKMSKSDCCEKGNLNLTDDPDVMFLKIKKAVTDLTANVTYEPETRPGVSNLVAIHSAVTGKSTRELCEEVSNLDTGMYKLVVAEALIEVMKPIQSRIKNLLTDKGYLMSVLKDGTEKAANIATERWESIREKIGSRIIE